MKQFSVLSSQSPVSRSVHGALMLSASALLLLAGCRQDMHNQPKMIPQRGSDFFADHRGARPQIVNTVARGQLQADSYFYTGVVQGANGYREEKDQLPFPATMEVLERGQERFNIYCTPCHSRVGNGLGEIVQRGYKPAANLNDQVRRSQPISHYFYVMTHGYGAMPDYAAQLTPVGAESNGNAKSAGTKHKVLVLVQLRGGNDGLSMVVPFTSGLYYAQRGGLAVRS